MSPMIVRCASCHTEFQLDPSKVPAEGVRARCTVCSAVISVPPPPPPEGRVAEERQLTPVEVGGEAGSYQEQSTTIPQSESAGQADGPGTPSEGHSDAPVADRTTLRKHPINPFLARDPGLRAKRLARALVSDIIAYHPAKHAEGLRDGTLKTLFREEIKKSYDEYVDQVGREVAESTTYFQDALNEVLAAGKRLF